MGFAGINAEKVIIKFPIVGKPALQRLDKLAGKSAFGGTGRQPIGNHGGVVARANHEVDRRVVVVEKGSQGTYLYHSQTFGRGLVEHNERKSFVCLVILIIGSHLFEVFLPGIWLLKVTLLVGLCQGRMVAEVGIIYESSVILLYCLKLPVIALKLFGNCFAKVKAGVGNGR